jgi:UDPglucose--hexose-1-phosphate uridylyltransferase
VSLRVDPFTGRTVLIAPHRRSPGRRGILPSPPGPCPFCPGSEGTTRDTLAQVPAEGPWQMRAFENRHPLELGPGGAHEVIVETPAHDADLPDLEAAHLASLIAFWAARLAHHRGRGAAHVALFRNRGRRSGSSQPHPHSQIAALSWLPEDVRQRAALAAAHRTRTGRSLHESQLAFEREDGRRILEASGPFVALCPYAPSRPFEVRLVPVDPRLPFGAPGTEADLGALLRRSLGALRAAAEAPDYNLVLRHGTGDGWHLEVLPRTGGDAGFELATGAPIVVVEPEVAAAALRASLSTS